MRQVVNYIHSMFASWRAGSKRAKRRAFVGMSGGVDSSVSAALLLSAGYDVTGVFIKVWQPDWMPCNWKEERLEAMRAAAHLGIPFVTLDLEKEYKSEVIDYMIAEYKAGRTPNPDVMCNRHVKFGAFSKWARDNGSDVIATGHYARVEKDQNGSYRLLAGSDKSKDQSYFLWTLGQEDLKNIVFPVGGMQKYEVRRLARKLRLPNAEKKDSQGLCFMGKVDLKEFLSHYVKSEPGILINESGNKIGTHPGAIFFTIGERHGFHVNEKTPDDAPYYVIDKDVETNTVTVSNRDSFSRLPQSSKETRIAKTNWTNGDVPSGDIMVRTRYRQPLEKASIKRSGIIETIVGFETPQDTLTAGQSLVAYRGEECLGGGIIQ